jgi:hypothetical protein
MCRLRLLLLRFHALYELPVEKLVGVFSCATFQASVQKPPELAAFGAVGRITYWINFSSSLLEALMGGVVVAFAGPDLA